MWRIVRVATPFETLHPDYFFGAIQHEGRLDFRDGDAGYEAIKQASAAVPTMVAMDLDRPAILTNVRDPGESHRRYVRCKRCGLARRDCGSRAG